jgi:ComF family protein
VRVKPVIEGLRELGGAALDLLYPPRCLTCDALAAPFCAACAARIERVSGDGHAPAGVTEIRSLGYHRGPLRKAVLRLKFQRKVALADALAPLLAAELREVLAEWEPHGLVAVPLHWSRRLERGFNQSELLAAAVGRLVDLPALPVLVRTRRTPPQVGRSREARATNLRGAFALAHPGAVRGQRLILLDDVRTTGATLAECARTLREGGAEEVFALTVTSDPAP